MIGISQIRDAFKTIAPGFNSYQVGKLNEKEEKELAFYHIDASTSKYHRFIGEQCYRILPCQIIVHGYHENNNGFVQTEQLANEVYEKIEKVNKLQFENFEIVMINLIDNYPRCLWTNSEGIYEFSIETFIYISEK